MAQTDELSLARSYRMAADAIVAKALRSRDLSYEYAYPALYMYRHVLELYLKLIVQPEKPSHGIKKLARQFKAVVRAKLKLKIPDWVLNHLYAFGEFDPDSQGLRYTKHPDGNQIWLPGEYWVSYGHLRKTMSVLAEGFEKAYFALPGKKNRS